MNELTLVLANHISDKVIDDVIEGLGKSYKVWFSFSESRLGGVQMFLEAKYKIPKHVFEKDF